MNVSALNITLAIEWLSLSSGHHNSSPEPNGST